MKYQRKALLSLVVLPGSLLMSSEGQSSVRLAPPHAVLLMPVTKTQKEGRSEEAAPSPCITAEIHKIPEGVEGREGLVERLLQEVALPEVLVISHRKAKDLGELVVGKVVPLKGTDSA